MNPQVQVALNWWRERHVRERLLVLAGATAVVLVLGDSLFTQPLERRLKQARVQTQEQQAQAEKLRAEMGDSSGAQGQREQAVQLQARLQAALNASNTLRSRAADAARLPETLRAITATVGSAQLLALDLSGDPGGAAAAAAAAVASAASAAAPAPATGPALAKAQNGTRLYPLPITLKVSGTYEELHMLLTQIERHAEALQWQHLSLDSSKWPAIELTLKAHVYSPSPRWGAAS